MYTIGQVSEMFHLPVSTLRYYDKEASSPTSNANPASANSTTTNWKPSA
mgnify:CR=1 FL=1